MGRPDDVCQAGPFICFWRLTGPEALGSDERSANGWINSVSLMQTVVRQLVFVENKITFSSEISKMKSFPEDPSPSLVYLDSYDEIR